MIIAHLSDTHVREVGAPLPVGNVDYSTMAVNAFDRVARMKPTPDLMIITGDLTDSGQVGEYRRLQEIVETLPFPVHMVLGNHDIRENYLTVFPEKREAETGFAQFCLELQDLRIIGLDSLIEGHGHGGLCAARLSYLRGRLAERPEVPTIIMLHHQPFIFNGGVYDDVGLKDGVEEFGAIVAGNRQIVRVLCGHLHRSLESLWNGTLVSVTPSVVCAADLPVGDVRIFKNVNEPPAFKLHVLVPESGLVSHTVFVKDFGPPYENLPDPNYQGIASMMEQTGQGAVR
ncbi:phosphodiesterase [Rhizobium leguminosarum]|uniref:phosphodiesterase n=1 Tax=Rhizobium leguminosarum TaxID=384 RepID=UPI001C9755BA|nr:phosphodiesterase [Rhizobium leguminosarum]MBY5720921.1 phosphodiesterase [Rhizobium leguminosarum]